MYNYNRRVVPFFHFFVYADGRHNVNNVNNIDLEFNRYANRNPKKKKLNKITYK